MTDKHCPICGLVTEDGPRDWDICSCCGIQYCYDDWRPHAEIRADWIAGGKKWYSHVVPPPPGWDPDEQLKIFSKSS